jgi:hypothetical protein
MPAFVTTGSRAASASAATISPAKPTVSGGGGVLLAVVTSKNNATHSTATPGWSLVGSQTNSGASFTASLWIAAQSAAAPTFTWTGAAACSAQIAYYFDLAGPMDASVNASTVSTGSTSTHTSTSFNSTRANALAVYIDVVSANPFMDTPSGWTERSENGFQADTGSTVFGDKTLGAAGSASGAISVNGPAAAWVQWQVELRIALAAADFESSKIEAGAWYDTGEGLNAAKLEAGAWYDPGNGLNASKIEIGAWLENPTELSASKIEVGAWLEGVAAGAGRRRQPLLGSF